MKRRAAEAIEPDTSRDEFEQLFMVLQQAIAAQQLTVIEWLTADPALLDVFEKAGGDRDLFLETDDVRGELDAIYCAIETARQVKGDRDRAARLAILALKNISAWSDEDDWGGGSTWTIKRLARLFESSYPNSGEVNRHTLKLIDLRRRSREAAEHLRQAHKLLTEALDDMTDRVEQFAVESSPQQMSVTVRIRRRKGNGVCRTIQI